MKLKKVLVILLCLGLVTLSACANDNKGKDNKETNTSSSSNSQSEEEKMATKVQMNAESQKLNDILSSIKSSEAGSSNSIISTMKKIKASVQLMQWANTRTMSDNMIKDVVNNFSSQLSENELTNFKSSINKVADISSDLAKNWKDKKKEIEAAGLSDLYKSFTPDIDKINSVLDALQSQAK